MVMLDSVNKKHANRLALADCWGFNNLWLSFSGFRTMIGCVESLLSKRVRRSVSILPLWDSSAGNAARLMLVCHNPTRNIIEYLRSLEESMALQQSAGIANAANCNGRDA